MLNALLNSVGAIKHFMIHDFLIFYLEPFCQFQGNIFTIQTIEINIFNKANFIANE